MCIFTTQGCVVVFAKVLVDTHSGQHKQNKIISSSLEQLRNGSKVRHASLGQDIIQSRFQRTSKILFQESQIAVSLFRLQILEKKV